MTAEAIFDLRKCIEKLSSEIDRQRDFLRDLEDRQKSAAQGELNAIFDPVSRIPLEISFDIMLRCLPTTPKVDPHVAPMIFLNICRSWNNIALATPALWAAIRFKSPFRDDFMHSWLDRAGARWPLSLSVVGTVTPDFCALFDRYRVRQIQGLELYFVLPSSRPDLGNIPFSSSFPCLKNLRIGSGTSKEGEDDGNFAGPLNTPPCDPDAWVEMLRAAPNLVECRLENIRFFARPVTFLVVHSTLRSLHIGRYPNWRPHLNQESTHILRHLTLPALEHLSVSTYIIGFDDFIAFLARSCAPLRSIGMVLHLHGPNMESMVERLLTLIPGIIDLDLCLTGDGTDLIALMATLHSRLLPTLRNLTVREAQLGVAEWDQVLRTLYARRTSLHCPMRSFTLFSYFGESEQADGYLTPKTMQAVRQLVAGGMEVHIGTETMNLISDL
ncbi:hypothetical protein B0H11DRAFT_1206875 [Mycena galericulata]|nr:hypothetical protein B0H11DRAFT_1206875 [Mycena galericulata]